MLTNRHDQDMPKCIFCSHILGVCTLYNSGSCHLCFKRIEDLNNLIIKHRFSNSQYKINQIYYSNIKRLYTTTEDLFQNPNFLPLKEVKYPDPEKKGWIRFNVFNLKDQEYFFEIFEIKISELHNFIWMLEEFGYSEQLLSKVKENILEQLEE